MTKLKEHRREICKQKSPRLVETFKKTYLWCKKKHQKKLNNILITRWTMHSLCTSCLGTFSTTFVHRKNDKWVMSSPVPSLSSAQRKIDPELFQDALLKLFNGDVCAMHIVYKKDKCITTVVIRIWLPWHIMRLVTGSANHHRLTKMINHHEA